MKVESFLLKSYNLCMSRIRKLYYYDKRSAQEMISFLNNSVNDTYINKIMFNPLLPLHHLLPLNLKFLPESYVLKEEKEIKGLITIAPTKCRQYKMEIQKLFFEENAYSVAAELVQYVVSKYKAMGATSVIVKVDDYFPELLSVFISKCGFSRISYEKLWRVNKAVDTNFDYKGYRAFRNSDASIISDMYNNSLLPHFRILLENEPDLYTDSILKGLSYYSEYKYVIEDENTKSLIGCIIIQTSDNDNYVADIIYTSGLDIDVAEILGFISSQIHKRKNRFGLFIRTKSYTQDGEKYENEFLKMGFECVQNQIVLTNSSAKLLKESSKNKKFTILTNFIPSAPIST